MATKVSVAGKEYTIDDETRNIMELFKEADALEKINANEPFEIDTVQQKTWEWVLELCKLTGNNFASPTKIHNNNLEEFIGAPLAEALKGKSWDDVNKLYQAAHYLKIKNLRRCVAAHLACKVFIKPSLDQYKKKMEELGIKGQLTAEQSKKMKETYGFMN